MSRSGYTDDYGDDDPWRMIMYRGAVNSAIKGKRGQQLLRELLVALDAMPEKWLTKNELEDEGEFCALGVLGRARGIPLKAIDPEDAEAVAETFNIATALAREIVYENDEVVDEDRYVDFEIAGPVRPAYPDWGSHRRTRIDPVKNVGAIRWAHMRAWVASHITEPAPANNLLKGQP